MQNSETDANLWAALVDASSVQPRSRDLQHACKGIKISFRTQDCLPKTVTPGKFVRSFIKSIHILKEGQNPHNINWQKDGFLGFEAYEGFDAWYGRLPREEYRKDWPHDGFQTDLSRFEELIKLLRPVPRDAIYPEFPTGQLTLYKPQRGDTKDAIYFKAPRLSHYQNDGSNAIAMRLLAEAKIHENILRNPHPNLGSYLGCIEDQGRIVRLAFKRYSKSVYDLVKFGKPEEFTSQQRLACIDQIEAATAYLHSLGLAHNDISPSNIMIDDKGQSILIDFDACAVLGEPLTKGGLVGGWRGPLVADEGNLFKVSSVECDRLAVREIRRFLMG